MFPPPREPPVVRVRQVCGPGKASWSPNCTGNEVGGPPPLRQKAFGRRKAPKMAIGGRGGNRQSGWNRGSSLMAALVPGRTAGRGREPFSFLPTRRVRPLPVDERCEGGQHR